jgi:ubiquinone/menaquinone biosynthesis C-methylase UbiE
MKIMRVMAAAFFLLILILATAPIAAQEGSADAWEKRLNELQPPDKIMEAIGVKPGMVIGEVGAGRGRFTVLLARRVGSEGKIYANDVDEGSLSYLSRRCRRERIENVVTILGRTDDPLFPAEALDLVFMINTYHHLARPVLLLRNIIPSLKPGAIVAIVEHDPAKSGAGWEKESTTPETMRRQASEAGFEVLRVETFLSQDNIFILGPKGS